jgi:hypothetical protein
MMPSVKRAEMGKPATTAVPLLVSDHSGLPPILERGSSRAETDRARNSRQEAMGGATVVHSFEMSGYVQQIASGDEGSLELVHRCYAPLIRGLANRLLVSAADAEEVLQDVFLELWRHPPRAEDGTRSLLAWMGSWYGWNEKSR